MNVLTNCFAPGLNKGKVGGRPSAVKNTEEERFKNRLWPPRALISFSRIITRCTPPPLSPGKPLLSSVSLVPHWMNDDLTSIPVTFDSPLMHSAVYFPLTVEESREATLHSLGGGTGAGVRPERGGYSSPHPPAWDTNGWLDAEVISVIQESDTAGTAPGSRSSESDLSHGTVWTLRVVLTPFATKNPLYRSSAPADGLGGAKDRDSIHNPGNVPYVSPAEIFTGGDLLVMYGDGEAGRRPVLGVVQGWDPEYESRYSETLQREWMSSDGRDPVSASKDADGREVMNILVTMDTSGASAGAVTLDVGSPSAVALRNAGRAKGRDAGGWAGPGQIRAGTILSVCALGSMMTSIRECQALMSFREVNPAFHRVILSAQSGGDGPADGRGAGGGRPVTMPQKLWERLCSDHNPSQLRAIRSICYGENGATSLSQPASAGNGAGAAPAGGSFSLLQGPPGTGKTRTILALVAAILAGATDKPVKKSTRIIPGQALRLGRSALSSQESSDSLDRQMAKAAAEASKKDVGSGPRVLICAPSNTAVDEIVFRLKTQGVLGPDGRKRHTLNVVRIGRAGGRAGAATDSAASRTSRGHTNHSTEMLRVVDRYSLDSLVEDFRRKQMDASGPGEHGGPRWGLVDARKRVLQESDVVCATLSGAGSQPLVEAVMRLPGFAFDAVVVDEAAQATEPSSLIPLKYNPRSVILVGDPAQLPATVFSKVAKQAGLGRSLFERLQQGGYPVSMLETQYRMHPHIAEYPSRAFYDSKLRTDEHLLSGAARDKAYHQDKSGRFRPLVLHDVHYGREEQEGLSILNRAEASYVCDLYAALLRLYPDGAAPRNVGCIAPYRAQRSLLKHMFRARFGPSADVEISTVDGFQGREKDIVIFSAVRAPSAGGAGRNGNNGGGGGGEEGIGFLKEWRRLNVAMTRARHALWLVGHREVLLRDKHCWGHLVRFVEERRWLHIAEAGAAGAGNGAGAGAGAGNGAGAGAGAGALYTDHRGGGRMKKARGGGGNRKGREKSRHRHREGEGEGERRPRKFLKQT